MSITYGFFDSRNHDRTYNASNFGHLFDGIITDGIFKDIGGALEVTANGSNMTISVASGKAWFNNTWLLNDAVYPIRIDTDAATVTRIDAIIIQIDITNRKNSIKVVRGTSTASTPSKPTLTNNETLHQYALAYVTIRKGATYILQTDIEDNRDTESCPYATGTTSIQPAPAEDIDAQYEDAFNQAFNIFKNDKQVEYDQFESQIVNELNSTEIGQIYNQISAKESKPYINMNQPLLANQMEVSFTFTKDLYADDYIVSFYSDDGNTIEASSTVTETSSYITVIATFVPVNHDRMIKMIVRSY